MQITEKIHTLEIPFTIPVAPDREISRSVFVNLIFDKHITLIDSGIKGAHKTIFAYIEQHGREPKEVRNLILSHSHPDHIGSAKTIHEQTGCSVLAHSDEKNWIEDTEKQKSERPVPGFDTLVDGPVRVDAFLEEDQDLEINPGVSCRVLHTPGHSRGSVSLCFPDEKILFTGDALPVPGDLPIYDDIAESLASIRKLTRASTEVNTILSSWEKPVIGAERIAQRIQKGIDYLERIHMTVIDMHRKNNIGGIDLCQSVVAELRLPPFAANPIVARAFMSSLPVADRTDLFSF